MDEMAVHAAAMLDVLHWLAARLQAATQSVELFLNGLLLTTETMEFFMESTLFQVDLNDDEKFAALAAFLNSAASRGKSGVVDTLLAYGADPNMELGRETPLTEITHRGDTQTLEVMLSHGAWLEGEYLLRLRRSDLAQGLVRDMLLRGADGNATSEALGSVLHHAALTCSNEVVRALLQDGYADVDARDRNGCTPLMVVGNDFWSEMALYLCERPIVELLLEYGADVHARDKNGRGVLHEIIYLWDLGCIRLILAQGADPNLQDDQGQTAMAWIVSQEQGEVIRDVNQRLSLLLHAGADPFIRDSTGVSVAQMLDRTETGRAFMHKKRAFFTQRLP